MQRGLAAPESSLDDMEPFCCRLEENKKGVGGVCGGDGIMKGEFDSGWNYPMIAPSCDSLHPMIPKRATCTRSHISMCKIGGGRHLENKHVKCLSRANPPVGPILATIVCLYQNSVAILGYNFPLFVGEMTASGREGLNHPADRLFWWLYLSRRNAARPPSALGAFLAI